MNEKILESVLELIQQQEAYRESGRISCAEHRIEVWDFAGSDFRLLMTRNHCGWNVGFRLSLHMDGEVQQSLTVIDMVLTGGDTVSEAVKAAWNLARWEWGGRQKKAAAEVTLALVDFIVAREREKFHDRAEGQPS